MFQELMLPPPLLSQLTSTPSRIPSKPYHLGSSVVRLQKARGRLEVECIVLSTRSVESMFELKSRFQEE